MSDTVWLSQEAYDRLVTELSTRETETRDEISRKIEAARAEGDLKENGGYHAAKEDQGHNEARIRQLKALLETAKVGVAPEAAEGKAAQGSLVTVRFDGDSETEQYLLASREEAQHAEVEVLSPSSPMGQALLGKSSGDSATYALPNGREVTVKIEGVEVYSAG